MPATLGEPAIAYRDCTSCARVTGSSGPNRPSSRPVIYPYSRQYRMAGLAQWLSMSKKASVGSGSAAKAVQPVQDRQRHRHRARAIRRFFRVFLIIFVYPSVSQTDSRAFWLLAER